MTVSRLYDYCEFSVRAGHLNEKRVFEQREQLLDRIVQIPLQCLRAAVEVLKSDPPSDRPLFGLPLEIRQLVRPLLQNKLNTYEHSWKDEFCASTIVVQRLANLCTIPTG